MKIALLILAALPRIASALDGPLLHERSIWSLTGQYSGIQAQAETPLRNHNYRLGVGVREFQVPFAGVGNVIEYGAYLWKELPHVSIGGRLATKPPDQQRAQYHIAQGDALLTWYGTKLGPSHPELLEAVWESTEPAPTAKSFEHDWITRVHARYVNTNHHLEGPTLLVLVQNTWQFEVSETWNGALSASVNAGFDRYNKVLNNLARVIFLDNVEYAGNAFAIPGWPNNRVGGELRQHWGGWSFSEGVTRLNLLDNHLEILYGVEARWQLGAPSPNPGPEIGMGYWHRRRRGAVTREAISLDLGLRF